MYPPVNWYAVQKMEKLDKRMVDISGGPLLISIPRLFPDGSGLIDACVSLGHSRNAVSVDATVTTMLVPTFKKNSNVPITCCCLKHFALSIHLTKQMKLI